MSVYNVYKPISSHDKIQNDIQLNFINISLQENTEHSHNIIILCYTCQVYKFQLCKFMRIII